jgi:hypothetical protein
VLIAWLGTNILLLMAAVLALASLLTSRSGATIKAAAGACSWPCWLPRWV